MLHWRCLRTVGFIQRLESSLPKSDSYYRLLPAPSPCTIWTTTSKLFSVPNADDTGQQLSEPIEIITDSAHDDALGSRIAALLMVDFGLRDLDLDVGTTSDK